MHQLLLVEGQVTIVFPEREGGPAIVFPITIVASLHDAKCVQLKLASQNLRAIGTKIYLPRFSQFRWRLAE